MSLALRRHRLAYTTRLELRAVSVADVDVLFGLNSDPRVWTHLPSGVHTARGQTAEQVAWVAQAWDRDGLAYWTAWRRDDGAFVGIGGCRRTGGGVAWNLYYRFAPEAQGNGFATEVAEAALAAARSVNPELPVVALILEGNPASRAVAEKVGLRLTWRGPAAGNPDPNAIRLVYADRDLAQPAIDSILAHP